jgi:hypothetical protein
MAVLTYNFAGNRTLQDQLILKGKEIFKLNTELCKFKHLNYSNNCYTLNAWLDHRKPAGSFLVGFVNIGSQWHLSDF